MATSKKIINSILVLRILTLLFLAASIVIMGLNNYKIGTGPKVFFTAFHAYRYVVAVAGIGFVYSLIQIPFAAYHSIKDKKITRQGCMREFDFYGDKMISYLLASGVGVGFGVSVEVKPLLKVTLDAFQALGAEDVDDFRSKDNTFINQGIISTALLLAAFLLIALTSILTSIIRSETETETGRFFG